MNLGIGVAFLLGLSSVGTATDEKDWARAMGQWQRLSGSKSAADRAQAVSALGDATYEKKDKHCFALVYAMLRTELARGKGGKKEEEISNDVLEACIGALKKIREKKAVERLIKAASKGADWRLRTHFVWALGGIPGDEVATALVGLAEDKLEAIGIAALDALREKADEKHAPLFLKVAADAKRTWEVRLAALLALGKIAKEAHIEPLLEGLGKAGDAGRVKDEYLSLLRKLTGLDLNTDDPNAWRTAWTAKKSGKDPKAGGTTVEPTEFFGLKTRSTRIVFVLDRTGSMAAELVTDDVKTPAKEPPLPTGGKKEPPIERASREQVGQIYKKWAKMKTRTRMEYLKREFIRTLYFLSPKVHFTVVWYEANQQPWRDFLVPATWKTKLEIIREVEKLQPSGGTNVWGGLEYAFKLIADRRRPDIVKVDKKGNYATSLNGADTFFLMTDGQHNTGKFVKTNTQPRQNPVDADAFLGELKKINRLRKVIVHTICLGSKDHPEYGKPDADLMESIAKLTGGDFSHVKDK